MNSGPVLIVAANAFDLALMGDLLEANGVRTVRAATPRDALRLAESGQPSLVVVDIGLPGNGSHRVVQSLRARNATRDIPVVAVADRTQKQQAEAILDRAYSACVDKPINTTGFSRTVMRTMRGHV